MDEEPVGRGAGLADVAHLGGHRALDGRVEVGVLEDDERRIATELHRDAQQLLGRLLDQLASHGGRPGEGELSGARVADQRLHHGTGLAGRDDVHHPVVDADLLQELAQRQHRERCLGSGLDDHGAAGGQSRTDLAGAHRQREVPRRDHQDRPDRLAHREQAGTTGRGLHVGAVDARGLLGEPAEVLGAVGDLAAGLSQRLAHLGRHDLGEHLLPVHEQFEGGAQDLAPLTRGAVAPLLLRGNSRVEGGHPVGR